MNLSQNIQTHHRNALIINDLRGGVKPIPLII